MSYDLGDYKEVPERIAEFAEKYPLGSLQGKGFFVRDPDEKIIGYHYQAQAFRTPDDPRPGIGTAYEPIPGKTPYTKDSEVMNAETSAWGRAIVALGFSTKKIASANEVRARQAPDGEADSRSEEEAPLSPPPPSSPSGFQPPTAVREELERKNASMVLPRDGGIPEEVEVTFGKYKGKKVKELLDEDVNYLNWLASPKFEPKSAEQRRIKGAVQTVLSMPVDEEPALVGAEPDDSIPF